ncbi:ABC transporter permease [Faecalicatena sp. AGMB00832]|uniref:ABC transporter permease n=1 Tax=Faecalicatena faecalis TaxID=2726362 RepID=A0ABS6D6V3_9FIRM|nr:ABC transporter permease [Faecalicatena faecalis]MBU3877214.1 ABC transporter permease [Faecalicatena faecalis]
MNHMQLAWRSVIRKPVKSMLLLLVVCVISVFLLSGMAASNASVAVQDKTRQAVGAGLLLVENEANRHTRLDRITEKIGEKEGSLDGVHQKKLETADGPVWMSYTDSSFETLRLEDIEKLAAVPGISDYNIATAPMAVNPVNFSRIEDPDLDQTGDKLGVSLIGNRDMTMDFNVLSGNVTMKEGRMVTREDQNVCVISEELAAHNGLKIGDKMEFNDYHDRENADAHAAEIIGIYQVKQKMTPYMSGDTYRSENVIFTDLRFPEKAEGAEGDPLFEKAYFMVEDVDQYDAVKEAVKKVKIGWERYDLIDNKGNLETMSSNFRDLQKISQIMIGVVAGASFVILFFVFLFWLKNRTQEVGIFLSLGIPKQRILGQILLEAFMIAAVAVTLSFAVAPGVSKITADYLVSQQIEQAEVEEELNEGKVAKSGQDPEQEVTGVHVEITPQMIAFDSLGIVVLITTSVLTAGISVVKRNPRDILTS